MKFLVFLFMSVMLITPITKQSQAQESPAAVTTPTVASEVATPTDRPSETFPEHVVLADASAKSVTVDEKSVTDAIKTSLNEQGEAMTVQEEPTEPDDVIVGISQVYTDWKTGGWMAGLLATVYLLMTLLKLGPVNDYLRRRQLMWLKPILAGALGAAGGGLAAGISGVPLMKVVAASVSGLVAGLGAVGLYEVSKRRLAENRTR